jgi:RNA polymerase sigma-70 factor (ECF subfamily)
MPTATATADAGLEDHRADLRAHCRRVLGLSSEVDDAVQETMLRAWRHIDRFEGRSTIRTWLRRVATNVCIDMQRSPQRRARPVAAGDLPGPVEAAPGPGETAVRRDEVRQALAVALGCLPPRQRAVLVLREVFGWSAGEVAALLDDSVASVNSALQRARATLRAGHVPLAVGDDLLAPCLHAFDRCEIEVLASLLRDAG